MIFKKTLLFNFDNSGAKKIECIHIIGKNKKYAFVGNLVLVTIKKIKSKKKVQKKKIYTCVVIGTKKRIKRKNGTFINFDKNRSLLLVSKTLKFLGTRVYGVIPKEIRVKNQAVKFKKIISYSKLTV